MTTENAKPTAKKIKKSAEDKLARMERENRELREKLAEKENVIQLNEYINVVSLIPYTLNLSTQPQGQGSKFRFTRFGEVKRILYNDLATVIENQYSFLEKGYFYILDKRVIRNHGLDDLYDKILTKEKIQEILSFEPKVAVELYRSAPDSQREVIDSMLVKKIKADEADLNIVSEINKISGIDLIKIAQDSVSLDESASA